ncbi:MAG: response regulator [Bacteroidales bacterium]|jgi:PleD family two-component response regulator|nr:response regulator [Bacteroidales bacterium]
MTNNAKILIVDDDSLGLRLMKKALDGKVYKIATANNGKTALTKAWANNFDIIILDIKLPDINGFQICEKLKQHPATTNVPVVFLTGLNNHNDVVKGFEVGAVDYISKPFNSDEFNIRIENHLKLRDYSKNLEESSRISDEAKQNINTFISSLAHEFKTPLNSIVGFSEILQSKNISDEDKHTHLKHINNSGQKLLQLLNDLSDFSKLEAGLLDFRMSNVFLNNEIRDIMDNSIDKLYNVHGDKVKLNLDLGNDDPKFTFLTDILRLTQVFNNLIDNAIKYTESGTITIGYQLKSNQRIRFFVKDTGIGISENDIENIFQEYELAHQKMNTTKAGKGIGLAISKKITYLLNGEIGANSAPGKGSEFHFTLPRLKEGSEEVKALSREEELYNWEGKKILIAEDVLVNYLFFVALLKKTNVKLFHAVNGYQVLDILKETEVDLILMDMVMPELDGIATTKEVRKTHLHVPIIAQTSMTDRTDKDEIYKAGCNDIISKPIKPHILLNKIDRFFV